MVPRQSGTRVQVQGLGSTQCTPPLLPHILETAEISGKSTEAYTRFGSNDAVVWLVGWLLVDLGVLHTSFILLRDGGFDMLLGYTISTCIPPA